MQLDQAIAQRTSYRKAFRDDPVSREDLQEIVQAGILAPSGYGAQSTSFVIVDEESLIRKIEAIAGKRPVLSTARAIIVVIMDPNATSDQTYGFGVEDYAAATENILLSVVDHGYASVWIDGALRSDGVAGKIGELLGIPEEREVRVILPVGVPVETPTPKAKKPFAQRAWFNRFGGEGKAQ